MLFNTATQRTPCRQITATCTHVSRNTMLAVDNGSGIALLVLLCQSLHWDGLFHTLPLYPIINNKTRLLLLTNQQSHNFKFGCHN